MAKLTDRQRKKIIVDRTDGLTIRQLAKKYKVSTTTIQRTLRSDDDFAQKVTDKKEENAADVLAYMDSKKDIVCEIIGKGLLALNDPEKLAAATPAQITTALGTLIDKWALISGGRAESTREDDLSRSLREMAEGLESDD